MRLRLVILLLVALGGRVVAQGGTLGCHILGIVVLMMERENFGS